VTQDWRRAEDHGEVTLRNLMRANVLKEDKCERDKLIVTGRDENTGCRRF